MALKRCPECGGMMSSTASTCPHCGWVCDCTGCRWDTPVDDGYICFLGHRYGKKCESYEDDD